MKITILPIAAFLFLQTTASGFCGFYVARADVKLFNKTSQVILVRDGNRNVLTMSSDFQGDVKDFAMVVPVPVVLKEKDIRVADRAIFDKLDAYSGPRLVEYYDSNPCDQVYYDDARNYPSMGISLKSVKEESVGYKDKVNKVTIEAKYTVGEYDILILSAEESGGLETWLTENGYKIPEGASEVLEPYIKSNMKFFVVKVNLEKFESSGVETLNPIQISYPSGNFMLPIRLGMANADTDQDMVVYALTRQGRIETTNYRTIKLPTDRNIPTFVKDNFGQFYVDLFKRSWKRDGKNAVYLEYAWDLSSSNFVKCDPCASTPPVYADLKEAGAFWITQGGSGGWGGADYSGNIFMTRLHVRYNRQSFPQDLVFQETPNREPYQGRYIMTHPAQGTLDCDQGQTYLISLVARMKKELEELAYLTGSSSDKYAEYYRKYEKMIKEPPLRYITPEDSGVQDKGSLLPPGLDDRANNDQGTGSVATAGLQYEAVGEDDSDVSSASGFAGIRQLGPKILFGGILLLCLFYVVRAFRPGLAGKVE